MTWLTLPHEKDLKFLDDAPHDRPWLYHRDIGTYLKNEFGTFNISIDVGSNYGQFARLLSPLSKWVHSFEMNPDIHICFEENLRDCNNVTLHKNGLGHKNITAYTNKDQWSGVQKVNFTSGTKIDLKTLDSYKFNDVDFIKIDVEGSEHLVIEGAVETISKNKPIIHIELLGGRNWGGERCEKRGRILDLLNRLEYKLFDKRHEDLIFVP
jgi:FkbM family methyltransferase